MEWALVYGVVEGGEALAAQSFPTAPGEDGFAFGAEDAAEENAELAFGDEGGAQVGRAGFDGLAVDGIEGAMFLALVEGELGEQGVALVPAFGFRAGFELAGDLVAEEVGEIGNVLGGVVFHGEEDAVLLRAGGGGVLGGGGERDEDEEVPHG